MQARLNEHVCPGTTRARRSQARIHRIANSLRPFHPIGHVVWLFVGPSNAEQVCKFCCDV